MELKVIKNKLSFEEYTRFINNVIYTIFTFDDNNSPTSYMPELNAFALRLEFAKAYMGYDSTDKDIDTLFDDVISINMYEHNDEGLVYEQFSSMISVINSKIDFLKQQLLNQSKKDSLSELLDSITSVVNNMNEKLKDVDTSNVNELINGFIKISGKMDNLSEKQIIDSVLKMINKSSKSNKKNVKYD